MGSARADQLAETQFPSWCSVGEFSELGVVFGGGTFISELGLNCCGGEGTEIGRRKLYTFP